jgi:hypothetical protein
MKPSSHVVLTSLCALSSTAMLAGCPGGTSDGKTVQQEPFRDSWRTEHEGDFDLLDDDDVPRILSLTIGTPDPFGDNFINRGDVIVDFTGEDGRIKIEMRRFTFANSEEEAEEEVFDKLDLWAYNANTGTPKRPADMEEDADCTDDAEAWLDGCAIYVYYDGQNQLERAGADLRVTLPADYRQQLDIVTSDNIREDTYPNHGNVCVNSLNAVADIELESGVAFVKMAADASPAPVCDAVGIKDCTDTTDPTTTASIEGLWSSKCICANMLKMGSLTVEAEAPRAANITVDAPAEFWASITAENEAGNSGEDVCPVSIEDFNSFVPNEAQFDPDQPWRLIGDANIPSDVALAGGGYAMKLTSSECAPVASVEKPKDWDAEADDPDTEVRGHVTVCAGCLGDNPCEDPIFD